MPVELREMARATRKLAISGSNGRSAASPVNLAPKSGPRLRGVDCGRSAQERHVKEARVVSKKWAFLNRCAPDSQEERDWPAAQLALAVIF